MIGSRNVRRIGLVLAASCISAASAWAGAFEKELGSDAGALAADKVKLNMMNGNGDGSDSGRGPVVYYKALGAPPKRVALLSFYVWDCGNKKESSYRIYGGNYTYHVKNSRVRAVGADAVDIIASEIYDASIDGLKATFAASGMQLLTADEYLDTDAKKAAYDAINVDIGFSQKFMGHFTKGEGDNTKLSGAPEGYRVLKLATRNDLKGHHFDLAMQGIGVGKIAELLGGDVTKQLGVDAVVILYNVVQAEKKDITLYASGLQMFGPNPVPDTGASLYWKGHQYSGTYLKMDVPFITTDGNGNIVETDYAGYAVVAKALATKMGDHLKEKIGGGK
jgi:hypothetical protein